MNELRFAAIGAGFWSTYQIAGWHELGEARCVAVYNRTRRKAEALAARFDIPAVYSDPAEMLDKESLDFVDVITDVDTHGLFVRLAAARRLPVVCQKPLAATLAEARGLRDACREAGVPLLVNENFRWQAPLRALHAVLQTGVLGRVFRGRIQYANSFPVFDNQPFLKELEQFILTDMGTHILDVARFLFGEPASVYCRICRVNPGIRGEDVATLMLGLPDQVTVNCELSYATRMEHERFPQTFVFVEGEKGSVELGVDYWVRVTTAAGTMARRHAPPHYSWADPAYDIVHASIVDCQRNLVQALRCEAPAETTADDNLRTLRLVHAAYQSAAENRVIDLRGTP